MNRQPKYKFGDKVSLIITVNGDAASWTEEYILQVISIKAVGMYTNKVLEEPFVYHYGVAQKMPNPWEDVEPWCFVKEDDMKVITNGL